MTVRRGVAKATQGILPGMYREDHVKPKPRIPQVKRCTCRNMEAWRIIETEQRFRNLGRLSRRCDRLTIACGECWAIWHGWAMDMTYHMPKVASTGFQRHLTEMWAAR